MRVGIAIEETWDFFQELYQELTNTFQVSLFKRREYNLPVFNTRVNRMIFQQDIQSLLMNNDVVFFEWASHLLYEATRHKKTCGIVTRLHRYEMYQWVDKINWENVDRIILVSEALQEEFIEKFPEQKSKTIVLNAGVSLKKFSYQPKSFQGRIGTLCHLTPRKRVYDLILAFSDLKERMEGLSLHIAGDEQPNHQDYANSMRHLVKKLGLQNKVNFYGYLDDPSTWYKNIDIFISNSYSEGLQVALIEAMASGCYPLSHGWKGVDEILPLDNIYYTNTEFITKIMEYCKMSEEEKQNIIIDIRKKVFEICDVDMIKQQVVNIVRDVGEIYKN